MEENVYDMGDIDIGWCLGCGNFIILDLLKKTLVELGIDPHDLVIVSGIGQAAKTPHYVKTNFISGLHGRSLPIAMAIKAVDPDLKVIAMSGDACTYAEGGNHLIHAIRRNINVTNIVHNNMIMGLTKGQSSPTSERGLITPLQVTGVINEPFNPLRFAIALGASFVARAFCGDREKTKELLIEAINHEGYALLDILQPCVSFNKINTYKWFKEKTYYLEDDHDSQNIVEAFKRASETSKIPLGIFYRDKNRPTYEDNLDVYRHDKTPIVWRK
ncbi:MAG: thiamine pyrophosphate-dependent enzyme, partial [Candidatus Helarchaeota archaeon]